MRGTRAGSFAAVVAVVAGTLLSRPESARGQEGPLPTVTLDDAVELALRRAPALIQARGSLENAEWGRRSAYGAFVPSLSASSGAALSSSTRFDPGTDRIVTGSEDSYNAGVSLSYNLFSGGRRFAELSQSRAEVGAAEADLENQTFQVTLQTKTRFFDALRQEELLEVARARVGRAEQSLAMVRRRVQVGSGTRSDSLRASLELANARQSVLQAEAATRAARFTLARQIGESRPVEPVRPAGLEPGPLALSDEEILKLAVESSPAVQSAEADLRAAGAGVTASRAQYLPSLRYSTGYTWANDDAAFSGGRTSWNMRLSMSYPIFNGFVREANLERARVAERVARVVAEDARLLAGAEADQALRALRTAEQAASIAEEGLAVAEEDLRVVEERYRLGVATFLDLITSQVAVDEAGAALVGARYDYVVARAELEAIVGRTL